MHRADKSTSENLLLQPELFFVQIGKSLTYIGTKLKKASKTALGLLTQVRTKNGLIGTSVLKLSSSLSNSILSLYQSTTLKIYHRLRITNCRAPPPYTDKV